MEKINLVEILKDCPYGMELYSPLCGDCKLYDVNDYSIRIETPNKDTLISLYHDGRYCSGGEIMIFPKGKTTWEGFVPPCKFKDGDKIRLKENHNYIYTITGIREEENKYECGGTFVLRFSEQDNWELVPNKFDINTLVPFESRVLIRDSKSQKWSPAIWGFYDSDSQDYRYKLVGIIARYCIPYEGNEHLLGKTNDCDEYYKTWK